MPPGIANVCSYLCGLDGVIWLSWGGCQQSGYYSCTRVHESVAQPVFEQCPSLPFILASRAARIQAKCTSFVAQWVCPRSRSARVYRQNVRPCRSASLSAIAILSMAPQASYQDQRTVTTHSVVFQVLLGIRRWIASLIAFPNIDGPNRSLLSALARQLEGFSII